MGLATIVNDCVVFGEHRFGAKSVVVAEMLWWINVVLSLVCGALIPYFKFTRQEHRLHQMTAVCLHPVVPAELRR